MYQGYLNLGGNEVINEPRAVGYTQSGDCPIMWLDADGCDHLAEALRHQLYDRQYMESAPWFDPDVADVSKRFLGVSVVSVSGVDESTREATAVERAGAGARVVGYRHGSREVRARVMLTADGEDALTYGKNWLAAALEPGACGMHDVSCGRTSLSFFSSCPPERGHFDSFTEWETIRENLATNPSFEATSGGTSELRRNLTTRPLGPGTTSTSGFSGVNAATLELVTGSYPGIRITAPAGGTSDSGVALAPSTITGIVTGQTYTISVDVTGEVEDKWRISLQGGWAPGGNLNGARPVVRVGETVRLTLTFTAAGTSGALYVLRETSSVASQAVIRRVLVEQSSVALPFFDGSTPPKVRRNLAPNPSFETGLSGWLLTGVSAPVTQTDEWAVSGTYSARVTGFTSTSPDQGTLRSHGSGYNTFPFGMRPGGTYTVSAYVNYSAAHATFNTGGNSRQRRIVFLYSTNGSSTTALNGPQAPNEPGVHHLTHTFTIPENATGVFVDVGLATSPEDGALVQMVDGVLVEEGTALNPYFDGSTGAPQGFATDWESTPNVSPSYIYDADFTTSWTGAANASASVLTGEGVADTVLTNGMRAWQSTHWADSGDHSIRLRSLYANPDAGSFMQIGTFSAGTTPGKTYTARAVVRIPEPLTGVLRAESLRMQARAAGGASLAISAVTPNEAGEHEVVVSWVQPGDNYVSLRLYHGGTAGSGDVWWDSLTIVEGEYDGPYFDGDTIPEYTEDLRQFVWSGDENASTSLYQERYPVEIPYTDDEYEEIQLAPLRRYLHDVTCVSGPLLERSLTSQDGRHVGAIMEFTLLAENPRVFGEPREIDLGATFPFIMQDVPYNLVKYPSAEASSGTVEVARNYVPNPSLETNDTGWSAFDFPPSGFQQLAARSNELAASGSWSYLCKITGDAGATPQTGTPVTLTVEAPAVLLADLPAGSAPSFTIWAAAIIASGTQAQGTQIVSLKAYAKWYGTSGVGGDTVAQNELPGSGGVNGRVFTAPSIAVPDPPPGWTITGVGITVVAEVEATSSATPANNSDIRLFVDAAGITVP